MSSTTRYPFLDFRAGVWREIAKKVARDVPKVHTLVELGAGYGDFVNAFPARRKIAFELDPAMRAHVSPEVELHTADAAELAGVPPASVDLVFASNFLEHLERPRIRRLLERVREVLRPEGRLALIQPNFRLAPTHYFDDPTHVAVFSDESLAQTLVEAGFAIERLEPRFLPFSMRSRLPKWPALVGLYLRSPVRPLAGQMYVVARPR